MAAAFARRSRTHAKRHSNGIPDRDATALLDLKRKMRSRFGSAAFPVALWCMLAVPLAVSEAVELTLNVSNGICHIAWVPRIIRPRTPPGHCQTILASHIVQRSFDLHSWEDMVSIPGGINLSVDRFHFFTAVSTATPCVFFRVKERVELPGANLAGLALPGENLAGANLSNADLSGAILCGANLRGATLANAVLAEADLCNADLVGGEFERGGFD